MISVIIPTYNRAKVITRAIESVLAQTYKNYELIVVDDGSKDNTREVIASYSNRLMYIYQKNQGVSSARNTGIKASNGEWIAFLDSDDEWLPEKLSIQVRELEIYKDACLHTTNYFICKAEDQEKTYFDVVGFNRICRKNNLIYRPLEYQIKYGLAWTQCCLVRRDALYKAGLFDVKLRIYEDQDLMLRLALQGIWVVSNLPLAKVYRSGESTLNLSRLRISDPVGSTNSLVYIYENLAKSSNISWREKSLVEDKLYACRSAHASALLKKKRIKEARKIIKKCICEKITFGLIAKYIISYLPHFFIMRMLSMLEEIKKKGTCS